MATENKSITRQSPVTVLPGVGKARAAAYARLGIVTLGDLLLHYPRAYEDRGNICLLANAGTEGKSALILTVATSPKVVRLRSHKSFLKFRAFDDSGSCEIVYFNQDYLKDQFPIGSTFRFYGKVERNGTRFSMSSPSAEPYVDGIPLPPYHAVYHMTEGLSQKQLSKDVAAALSLLSTSAEDPLPADLRQKRGLCTLAYAEEHIHRPTSIESLAIARRRLVYEEFFLFALGAAKMQAATREHVAPVCENSDVSALLALLPYRLTGAQERVIEEIRRDMETDVPMSRIVVGDVGCGKTVCAAAAMLIAVQSGRQAALMAPTEILARQHYAELSPLFEALGIPCALLIGATSAAQKRKIREALSSSNPSTRLPVVIGTHALLSDGVDFASPGIVITDEQHRFGVRQRAKLSEKSMNAHLLVMSATPIPRSLALILYGDLQLSKIDEMPPGRQRVDTFAVDESYRERLQSFIRRQVEEGGQIYVVCPAIEEAENEPDEVTLSSLLAEDKTLNEKPPLKAAVKYTDELRRAFPDLCIEFLHGKMKSTQKDEVMRRFSTGEVQILVSTTVIEVGVNVPNASLMIIENADRFGLSQLHQLRGRVGRGTRKSYCVLVTDSLERLGETSRARLDTMRTSYDGYAIAEQDLLQRGPGDFLASGQSASIRQSGGMRFRLADAGEDVSLLTDATVDARTLLENDPSLSDTPLLLDRVLDLFSQEAGLIS